MILFGLNWFYLKLGKELVRKYKNKEKEMQQKIFDCFLETFLVQIKRDT
jgi:hypothetical protein